VVPLASDAASIGLWQARVKLQILRREIISRGATAPKLRAALDTRRAVRLARTLRERICPLPHERAIELAGAIAAADGAAHGEVIGLQL
jgi:hypothetical protein